MVVPLDYSSIVLYGMVAGLVVLIVFSGLAGSGLGDSGFLGLAYYDDEAVFFLTSSIGNLDSLGYLAQEEKLDYGPL